MDYFGDTAVLVVTIPGFTHDMVVWDSQQHIRQSLFEQGFYWPSWGHDIRIVGRAGTVNQEFKREGAPSSSFESDGGLHIHGLTFPFLIIEVADTGSYQHTRRKVIESLMGSKGNTRFAIIIDLVQTTDVNPKDIDDAIFNVSEITDEEETNVAAESGNVNVAPAASGSNKRVAEDESDDTNIDRKHRASSAGPPPVAFPAVEENPPSRQSPTPSNSSVCAPTFSPALPHVYASVTVTVLTTRLIQHPTIPGKKQRICVSLINNAECWPAVPGRDVIFRFTWEDMNTKNYPAELQGRMFSINFRWFHDLLVSHFTGHSELPDMNSDDEDEVELKWYDGGEEFHVDENAVLGNEDVRSESGKASHHDDNEFPDHPNPYENDRYALGDDEEALNDVEQALDNLGQVLNNVGDALNEVEDALKDAEYEYYDVDGSTLLEEEPDDYYSTSQVDKPRFVTGLEVIPELDELMAETEGIIDETEGFMDEIDGLLDKIGDCQQCHADTVRGL